MNALLDVHHSDLLEAMHSLWEDRLGLTTYVAGGMSWYTEGILTYGREDVARQFLEGPLDGFHPRQYRRVTLEEARTMDWAVVCATMAEHQYGFARFAREKGARFVVQVGNVNQYVDYSLHPLVIGAGHIAPHQEFDKDGAFRFQPFPSKVLTHVASFVNIFPLLPDYRHFEEARALLPGWEFRVYGHHGDSGFVKPTAAIAARMRDFAFAWHDKETGDGYGHVIHYWAAIGRPLIGHASYYRGQMGEAYWEHGQTCIDLDRVSVHEATEMMRAIAADPVWYESMCVAIRARLDARVDYAKEAQDVKEALGL